MKENSSERAKRQAGQIGKFVAKKSREIDVLATPPVDNIATLVTPKHLLPNPEDEAQLDRALMDLKKRAGVGEIPLEGAHNSRENVGPSTQSFAGMKMGSTAEELILDRRKKQQGTLTTKEYDTHCSTLGLDPSSIFDISTTKAAMRARLSRFYPNKLPADDSAQQKVLRLQQRCIVARDLLVAQQKDN